MYILIFILNFRWIFSGRKNYKQSLLTPIMSGVTGMQLTGKKCFTRKLNWKYLQVKSIRHIGNSHTVQPSLSLYMDTDYFGKELYLTGTKVSLPSIQNFESFGFTGTRSWMLFPTTDFGGNGTCLKSIAKELIIHEANFSMTVGSIRQGCPRMKKSKFSKDSTSSLTLHMNLNTSQLLFDGEELRLPSPILFIEFSITGEEQWTIYAGTEFNGKSRCLSRFGQYQPGQLRKYRFKRAVGLSSEEKPDFGETWLVGSVRRGCFPASSVSDPISYNTLDYDDEDEEDDFWKSRRDDVEGSIFYNSTNGTVNSDTPYLNRKPKSILEDSDSGFHSVSVDVKIISIFLMVHFILKYL